MNRLTFLFLAGLITLFGLTPDRAAAQEPSAEKLAKELSNPVSDLISVPFQFNYDEGLGLEGDSGRYFLNIQPVIPTSISQDWNLVTRVILPVVYQESLFPAIPGVLPADDDDFGLSDTLTSFFLSPKQPVNGLIFGFGPAILLPTATNSELGSGKWSAGPTAVALTQQGGLTVGALSNHVWSFAGDDERDAVNRTFIQPFAAYAWPSGFTLTLNSESTYNWQTDEWTVPVNLVGSQIVDLGGQKASVFAGVRTYPESPDFGPDWGLRVGITFLFPTQ
jgi:hypothetical protein